VASGIEENIRRALASYLGNDNFRASVRATVNTDVRQIEETIFDPDSRVERSVQVVRSANSANQRSSTAPTTVAQNLPEENVQPTDGPESSEQSERREETTNYELNTKRIATMSNGYSVSRLSIAVVVNEGRLGEIIGTNATPEQRQARIAEIEALVASATGLDPSRGDVITVSAVEFVADDDLAGSAASGMFDTIGRHTGTLINAAAFIVVVFLVAWFGLRPLTAMLKPATASGSEAVAEAQRALPQPTERPALIDGAGEAAASPGLQMAPTEEFRPRIKPAPQERLSRMVDLNEERTAMILRKWAAQEAAS
jgi:flagellar M-ring protein FliF